MSENVLREKTKTFALMSINIYKLLVSKREYILSKQFLRSSTSIGANVFEANYSESRKDFAHKLHIALKEAVETSYWIELIESYNFISSKTEKLIELNNEIIRLLISSIKTAKSIKR